VVPDGSALPGAGLDCILTRAGELPMLGQHLQERAQVGYTVQISGASHVSFMDVPFLPMTDGSVVKPAIDAIKIQPERMWRITCDVLLAFFARHLNGAAAPLLDKAADDYPELIFGPP
jgi:hypothetical protein